MIPRTLDGTCVVLAVQRLVDLELPGENAHQVSYHIGWLNALNAVLDALDVPTKANGPAGDRAVPGSDERVS